MFALLAVLAFAIMAFRDFFTTAPDHQLGLLAIGLAFLAVHAVYEYAVPIVEKRRKGV